MRLSGKNALAIADKIFFSKSGKKPSLAKTYTMHYGWIKDKEGAVIDEVILSVMRAPRSYTKEDIVEINCHSGIVVLRKILDLALESGARLAEPGEFTQRAFLNGRIDLTQAEAVLDIVRAKTDKALAAGVEQLKGNISKKINKIRKLLVDTLAFLEAHIDFPEEEVETQKQRLWEKEIAGAKEDLKTLIQSSAEGKFLREGILAVICGRPNVGKSSLLNAMLKEERSIVTHLAGTTRDAIEETVDIKGIPVRLTDTAGLDIPRNIIEHKAIKKTKQHIKKADLTIFVMDSSQRLHPQETRLLKNLKAESTIVLLNKMDLKTRIEKEKISRIFPDYLEVSALRGKNIDKVEEKIAKMFWDGKLEQGAERLTVNLRHKKLLQQAYRCLEEAQESRKQGLSLEFIAEDIKRALDCLDEILGNKFSEDILEKIFSQFCIGK